MEQTAVEWLDEQITICFENYSGTTLYHKIGEKIEQAKEMEKEQQSYSKEEVINILMSMPVDSHANIIEWFEQFKNK